MPLNARYSCCDAGGYCSLLTFCVSAINTESHLLSWAGSISSSRVSKHFSLLLADLFLILSKAHLVELSVFLGTQGFDSS